MAPVILIKLHFQLYSISYFIAQLLPIMMLYNGSKTELLNCLMRSMFLPNLGPLLEAPSFL